MPQAPPFPPAWGYEQLIGNNKTNIINASIEAWKNAGREINQTTGLPLPDPSTGLVPTGMGAAIMFGMLPFVIGTIVYMRLQKLWVASTSMILTTVGLDYFKLIEGPFLWSIYIVTGLSLALSIAYHFWNKD